MATVITSEGPARAKRFPGELSESFEEALTALEAPRSGARRLKWNTALLQAVLGALPHHRNRQIENVGTQQTDGFYGGAFEDKQERERRYGEVYTVQNQGGGLLVRLEFPRQVPQSALKDELGIPDRMPDYAVDLGLRDGYLIVRGRLEDPKLRKLAAVSPAFPPDFTTHIKLPAPVRGFKYRFVDKTLEIVLIKE